MEIWKEHKSGYLVSNLGNIKGKLVEYLKKTVTSNGYEMVSFGLVHRIVVETFIGEIDEGLEINHIDFNKKNNNLNNLEIVTTSENQKHYVNHNKDKIIKGQDKVLSVLKDEDIYDIYDMIKEGYSNKEIANKYFIHDRYVSLIRYGKRWKHLWDKKFSKEDYILSTGNSTLPLKTMITIIDEICNNTKTNIELSKEYNLDPSIFSKVRHKKLWKDVWRQYLRQKI